MLLLDKFSGLFNHRPSTHSPDPPQPTPHSPPSDATSDQRQRAPVSDERNTALPSIASGTAPIQLDSASSSAQDDAHSYAKESRTPHQRSRSVRTFTPADQTVPARGSGMNRPPHKPLLSHDTRRRNRTSAEEEARLFPDSRSKEPADAVPIVPSGTSRSKPKAKLKTFGAFQPCDRISHGRDSGPVHAQGKTKEPTRGLSPGFSVPQLQDDGHRLGRPPKRQRRESNNTAEVPILLSDDDTGPFGMGSPSVTGNSARRSSHSSQMSSMTRKLLDPVHRMGVTEFRDVEQIVKVPRTPTKGSKRFHTVPADDSDDEKFTESAAKERRKRGLTPDQAPKPYSVLKSVEVPAADKTVSPARNVRESPPHNATSPRDQKKRSPRTSRKSPARDRDRRKKDRKRFPDDVESPDELQGEATVQPAPPFLSREHSNNSIEAKAIVVPDDADIHVQRGSPESQPTSNRISQGKETQGKERPGKTRTKGKKKGRFEAVVFLTGHHILRSPDREIEVRVDESTQMLSVASPSLDPSHICSFPLNKIINVVMGENPSPKASLQISKTGMDDNRIDIEFRSTKEKDGFCDFLEKSNIRIQSKKSNWMDSAFSRREQQLSSQRIGCKRPSDISEDSTSKSATPLSNSGVSKRQKVTDSLKDYPHQGSAGSPLRLTSSNRDPSLAEKPESSKGQETAVKIPVKRFTPDTFGNRATRSMSRRDQPATVVCDDDDDDNVLPTPIPKGKIIKWHRPLVYPRFGKKKAEVSAHDLERLRESEFLNDNLIGFYIRFLEDHLARRNEEVAKRVYFFNSYFFATLTNLPRGQRGINYEGVEKWTRNINLFDYDYIVVPINENAHWYVAIICNLPELQRLSKPAGTEADAMKKSSNEAGKEGKKSLGQYDGESQEVPETPVLSREPSFEKEASSKQDVDPRKEEVTRKRLASMSLSDTECPHESIPPSQPTETEPEWPAQEENPTSSPAKFSSPLYKPPLAYKAGSKGSPAPRGSPKKQTKPKRKTPFGKFDTNAPTIITFDSLNLGRSPTITTLREYLQAEAMSKQGLKIDTRNSIKGMRARAIPFQSNYSDCGLYLLAYVEKFVQDPDTFIQKLLRREMSEDTDWPDLRSGRLRARLRTFLDDLYDEQAGLNPQNQQAKSDKLSLMVDQRPITYLLGAPNNRPMKTSAQADDAKSTLSKRTLVDDWNESRPESTSLNLNQEMSPEANGASRDVIETPKDVVVEVPDSQEQDRNHLPVPPPSPPRVVINQAEIFKKSRRKAHEESTSTSRKEDEKPHGTAPSPEIVPESDTEPVAKLTAVEIPVTTKVSKTKHKSKPASE